ncbi:MAG: arginine decarboxylase, partial [Selenomonadaceae bacterium]|nr:arginine decarboxylase [Selenomonadaceae bacterium]
LREMARILHEKGMLLLVDEAHGAHLKFHAGLPPQAMDAGADLAAQSTHKLLGSLTQSSMLLGRKGRVDFSRVQEAASLLQSTSPNYLLLASLDIARMQMAMEGRERIARAVRLSEGLREAVRGLDGLESFGQEIVGNPGVCGLDATKVTISVRGLGLTGMEAERILRHQYKVQCELSDPYNLLFILSMADTETELARLVGALQGLVRKHRGKETFSISMELLEIPEQRMLPREAFFADKERVALEWAAGRVSAEQVVFYPPGIPVLCPGELVSRDLIAYIRRMQGLGRRIVGAEDAELRTLRVIR